MKFQPDRLQEGVITVGTRGSQLALWQAQNVMDNLTECYPEQRFAIKVITSKGDIEQEKPLPAIGGKGLFTEALDDALLNQEIHLAVHSHKDLPITSTGPITTAAVLEREKANDVVVSNTKQRLIDMPAGSIIGTSSTRRSAQLLALRRDFVIKNIRGNVDTRIKKVLDDTSEFHATLLAYAGVHRLNMLGSCSEILDIDQMLPAPAQGSIAIQCLKDSAIYSLCRAIDDKNSHLCTQAERGFLWGLGGGCSMPIAAYAEIKGDEIFMRGKVLSIDGKDEISLSGTQSNASLLSNDDAFQFGASLAQQALTRGARGLLSSCSPS